MDQSLPLWPRMAMLLAELRHVGQCPDRCSGLLGQSFPTTGEKEGVTLSYSSCLFVWCKRSHHGQFQSINVMPRDLESGRGADAASHVCSGAPLHVARRSELRQTPASLEAPFPLREEMQPHTGRWHDVHLVDCRRRGVPALPWVGGSGSSVPWVLLTLTWVRGLSAAGSGHIGCNHAQIPIKAEGDFAGEGTAATDSSCEWLSAPLTGAACACQQGHLAHPGWLRHSRLVCLGLFCLMQKPKVFS